MNDKYAKEIAKELRLIRIELQKLRTPQEQKGININGVDIDSSQLSELHEERAGEKVTIK